MSSKEKVFISFGGQTESYYKRVHQLCNKVKSLGYFTKVIPYSTYDLIQNYEFIQKHGEFLKNNTHGHGFWIWKPYIILKTLEKLNYGDFLVYADAGCDINPNGLKRLDQYQEMLEKNEYGLLTFQLDNNCTEIKYTKRNLFDFMETSHRDKYTSQIMATVLIMKKTDYVMNHMNKILEIASYNNYCLLNNNRGINEYPEFVDHRHDQSIHSLLVKSILRDNNQVEKPIVIPDETYFDPDWEKDGALYPIWARRFRYPVEESTTKSSSMNTIINIGSK